MKTMDNNRLTTDHDDAEDVFENSMAAYLDEAEHAMKTVKRGDVVEGTVVSIDRDEILVDIGLKSEAVLPLKELSSSGYGSLGEIHRNDTLLVYVLQPETPEGHAIVSIRKARQERQWRVAHEMFERGDIIDAEVIESNKGGLIVNLEGVRGFVPISQIMNLKREDSSENAETLAKLQAMVGKTLKLKIIEINRNRNRLILSERLAMQEWRARRRDELLAELQVGEVRHGVVSNLAHFGAFIDLGGADGLVHISQLAWSRVNHPSEVLHVGQEVEVQVLNIDKDRKKIGLSIKRAEIDPWTTVEQRYQVGQVVTGTITKIAPFGAFARLENGIEGLIHVTEIYPPTNDAKTSLREGQEVQVRVLRIESDRRRLGLSMRAVSAPDAAPAITDDLLDQAYQQMPPEPTAPAHAATPVASNGAAVARPAEEAPTTAFGAAFAQARRNASESNGHSAADAEPSEDSDA
jgi:small subunit ribosomal protein S1